MRVNDIIGELEKQIGPLKEQSEQAREYLRLKEILKNLEVNNFLREYEESGKRKKELDAKYEAASSELADTKAENEKAESEYKKLEERIVEIDSLLNEHRNKRQELLIFAEKKEGEIKLFLGNTEQILYPQEYNFILISSFFYKKQ